MNAKDELRLKLMETYRNASEGALFKSQEGKYFLKPAQSASFHMEGMLIGLFDGDIIHYSHMLELTQVYGAEILW